MHFYLFFSFSAKNIFLNVYREVNGSYYPFLFQTSGSQEYTEEYSKGHTEQIEEFAYAVADWLRRNKPDSVIVVFRGLGSVFKKRHQEGFNLDKKRLLILEELKVVDIDISAFYDRSSISFNGCKISKKRRKKRKHLSKEEINALKHKT